MKRREDLVVARRHWRDGAGLHFRDVGAGDARLGLRAGGEHDFLRAVTAQQPGKFFAFLRADVHRLVAAHETRAREDDRFEQIALGPNLSDARKIGPERAADVAHRVAGGAGGFGAVENLVPAPHVTVFECGADVVEPRARCCAGSPGAGGRSAVPRAARCASVSGA